MAQAYSSTYKSLLGSWWVRTLIALGLLVLLMVLIVTHIFGNFAKMGKAMSAPQPPTVVTGMKVELQDWQPQLNAIGSLRAYRGVDVTTEVAGLVRSVQIKSGMPVKAGDLLVQINIDADVAQLHSLEAAAELAATVLKRDQAQLDAEAIAQAQVDADRADLKSKQAQVAGQQATIDKKTIRAPFSGRLGITTVNPGQYLNTGDKIVSLQQIDPMYADFTVPQQQLAGLTVGQKVTVTTDAYPGQTFTGRVSAIDPRIDVSTRNVSVEATIENHKGLLVSGMFARADVDSGDKQQYLTLPQTSITYNPYGATVFVAETSDDKDASGKPVTKAQQVFVTTGPKRGDQVAVLTGLKPGQMVVTSGQLKLKSGSALRIDNSVQPANDIHPTPQEK